MGSFNQTCAVTHMPIVAGDPVACFLLASARPEGQEFEGYVGVGSVWQALSLPFFGVYNDYGSVKDIEPGTGASVNRAVLGKDVAAILAEAKETRKPPRINLRGFWGESDLRLMMVHSEVWNRLSSECRSHYGDRIVSSIEDGRVPEFLEFVRQISENYTREFLPEGTPVRPFMQAQDAMHRWRRDEETDPPFVSWFFEAMQEGGIHPMLRIRAKEAVNDMLMKGVGMDAVTDAVECCLSLQVFDRNMQSLRRAWAPQPGLGSQDTNYDIHEWVGSWVNDKCAAMREEYSYDDDEEARSP